MTTRILTDLHHHALAESLLMLFEDRQILGPTEVYFPFGLDWFTDNVWTFERKWHGDAVARQYLLGVWEMGFLGETDYGVRREDHRQPGRIQKGVTLAAAREMKWDFIIASLPDNDAGFHALAKQTGARFGVQVGNNLQFSDWAAAEFVLSSSTLPDEGLVDPSTWSRPVTYRGKPAVIYHQEFSLHDFRYDWPPVGPRNLVASFVNCFPEGPSYPQFLELARAYPEFDWRVYGALGTGQNDEFQAGEAGTTPAVADAMRACRVGIHQKHWSDGYGHVVHNWFSIGRPVVGIPRYYADKLAGPLFIDGVTSFDVERHSTAEVIDFLRRLRDDDDYHHTLCDNSAARFREIVDFDRDAAAVQAVMESVI